MIRYRPVGARQTEQSKPFLECQHFCGTPTSPDGASIGFSSKHAVIQSFPLQTQALTLARFLLQSNLHLTELVRATLQSDGSTSSWRSLFRLWLLIDRNLIPGWPNDEITNAQLPALMWLLGPDIDVSAGCRRLLE